MYKNHLTLNVLLLTGCILHCRTGSAQTNAPATQVEMVTQLLQKVAELEARVKELEARAGAPSDFPKTVMPQAVDASDAFNRQSNMTVPEAASPIADHPDAMHSNS